MSCFEPSSQQELSDWIASSQQTKICWLDDFSDSQNSQKSNLKLSELKAVVDYPYRDMTITVEAGMTISALQAELEKHQQWLPVNVPSPKETTLAEVVCQNWFGSFSAGYGTMRDWLLGVTAIDGGGQIFHAGGRVVKNVAGYDLCKLLVGSQAKLAIPVEVTLQVKPIPQQILVHRFQAENTNHLNELWQQLRDLPFNPVIFDVICSSPESLQLAFAIEGTCKAIESQSQEVQSCLSQQKEVELVCVEDWNPAQEAWLMMTGDLSGRLLDQGQRTTLLRVGSLPSQTIDVLEIASNHYFVGFGVAARGMSILRSNHPAGISQEKIEADLKSLVVNFESLDASVQYLNREQKMNARTVKKKSVTSSLLLHQKMKEEFDPQNIF